MNNKTAILISLSLIIILLLGGIVFFIQKGAFKPFQKSPQTKQINTTQIEPIKFEPEDPAKMVIAQNQSNVVWQVSGQFVQPLEIRGDFLIGLFIVTGDESRQQLTIWMGPDDTGIFLGEPDPNAPQTKTIWQVNLFPAAIQKIPINKPVVIYLTNSTQSGDMKVIDEYKQFWLSVNSHIKNDHSLSTTSIDTSKWFYTNKVLL